MVLTRIVFGINLVYFLAFASLYVQLPGLIGDEGVAPVRLLDLSAPKTLDDLFLGIPSIIRFHHIFGLGAYHATEFLVVVGLALSFFSLAVPNLRGALSLFIQWISFLSIVQVCPGVLDWKWTSLLIEAGFLCFLLVIKPQKFSSTVITWLMRWLLFREAVTTGFSRFAKYNSPWWEFSAMKHYISAQISPTPVAWYLNVFPAGYFRILSVIVITMELFIPFLFLIPVHGIQLFSFFVKFMFHANMMLIGNFGIYNLLSIVLSFSLLPTAKRKQKRSSVCWSITSIAVTAAVLVVLFSGVWVLFGLKEGVEAMRITIPRAKFINWAKIVVFYTVPAASALFVIHLLLAAARSFQGRRFMKTFDLAGVVLVALLGSGLFVASLAPLSNLDDSGSIVHLPNFAHELTAALKPFHLANDYRFFHQKERNVLMQADQQRNVLVLEGALNQNGSWKEISFHHIPSAPYKMPSIIPGHLPVVDFEAALCSEKSFQDCPVIASLVYRILTRQEEVLPLLEPSGFPTGPRFIQIKKYTYEFSGPDISSHWWTRKFKSTYLRPTQAATPYLNKLLTKIGIVGRKRKRPMDATLVSSMLDRVRAALGQPSNLNGFYVALMVVLLSKIIF